jgi:hypothetical protein
MSRRPWPHLGIEQLRDGKTLHILDAIRQILARGSLQKPIGQNLAYCVSAHFPSWGDFPLLRFLGYDEHVQVRVGSIHAQAAYEREYMELAKTPGNW